MTATFKELNKPTSFNINHRKENHFYKQYAAIVINNDGRVYEAVTLRLYGTDAKSYCCVWVHGNCSWNGCNGDFWRNGSGSAGGYGYHRASAAAGEAIRNAGIELNEDIDGRGDSAIRDAVQAIASAMWPDYNVYISEAHA